MLTLPIKKKWFDMIKSGEKKEEYREIKTYWTKRFLKYDITKPFEVLFRNGYGKDKPTLKCKVKLMQYCPNKISWGAELNKLYYVLKIFEVEEIK